MSETYPPVVKNMIVKATPERAFARFTAEIGSWWPLASHSVFDGAADRVRFEGRVGGHIVEGTPDGRESVWGTVKAWDPPRRVAFTWHPGHEAAKAQDVEVTFSAEGDGTRVRLTHVGFERLGEKEGKMAARAYPIGWEYVLGMYTERRGLFMAALRTLTNTMLAVRAWKQRRAAA
jgi:uncharacterized protein YndB with AHSA1/START domain